MLEEADGRVERLQQNHVLRLLLVPGDAGIGAIPEEAEVHPRLEFLGALRLQLGGGAQLGASHQTADAVLRRGVPGALRDPSDDAAGIGLRRQVGKRLLPGLTIRQARLAVRQPWALADRFGELPRNLPLREPAAQVLRAERRGAVVAQGRHQVELILDIQRCLAEPGRIVDHRLLIERQVLGHRVGQLERLQGDERATDRSELPLVAGAQVLT